MVCQHRNVGAQWSGRPEKPRLTHTYTCLPGNILMMKLTLVLLFMTCVTLISGDIYLHNPRGSNNRLNENTAQRKNGNRVFDSQNNNRGGYNVGDASSSASGNKEDKQYRMKYFQSAAPNEGGKTRLTVEWTNQHGCGGNEATDPHKLNCNLVIQYMCQPDITSTTGTKEQDALRNGVQTTTQAYNRPNHLKENENQAKGRRSGNVKLERVYQEPWSWYDKCYVRERNKGLFTADQLLKSNNGLGYSSAIYTRQNPNGNRRGYECPEERDYFPYWHPTPWVDIAVLAENRTQCQHYRSKSYNVQPYHECLEFWDSAKTRRKHYSHWNNKENCTKNGGRWTLLQSFMEKALNYKSEGACQRASTRDTPLLWAVPHDTSDGVTPECLVKLPVPDCKEAPWTRSNHLGNGRDGEASNYTWVLPHFPSGDTMRCVLRFRYNISTDDYDPFATDYRHNKDKSTLVRSPVQQNPYIEVGAGASPLRLAINTAQFGRTFQDRSHVFLLMKRPAGTEKANIYNLNVRGKRGNIVQVYPAVEYDFVPNYMEIKDSDMVHIQWTGSNTHNNKPPGGDGQTGDAGEGRGGTDRNNMVEILSLTDNFPLPFEQTNLWKNAKVVWIHHGRTAGSPQDLALELASSGFYRCVKAGTGCQAKHVPGQTAGLEKVLDNAPASFPGVLLKVKAGHYYYICTRNNNFTNRSQKGHLNVK